MAREIGRAVHDLAVARRNSARALQRTRSGWPDSHYRLSRPAGLAESARMAGVAALPRRPGRSALAARPETYPGFAEEP
jgi:hypothetical protein